MSISINAAFDGGNIRLVRVEGRRVDLEIVRDHQSDFYQWFHFRAAGLGGERWTFRIVNAGGSAYPFGWPGYSTRASTDRQAWRQIPTSYADDMLSFDWEGGDLAWFAYFAPYTTERHNDLVARIAAVPGVRHRELGQSLDGQAIDAFTLGAGERHAWFYARQHPGEPMAEWFMEGLLEALVEPGNATAATLLAAMTIHAVPNMNPDGTRRGHLRTNAAGVNLNREWHAPSPGRSPEVLCVLEAMDATGVAFAMDVHGDEAIPANFIAGYEGIASWTADHGEKFYEFGRRLAALTPDFQTERGYVRAKAGQANMSMSTNQLAERFGAVACTLEMPFKDHDPNPDPAFGWSPDRCKALARAALLRCHHDEAHASTPRENAHVLDAGGLRAPGVAFYAAWDGEALAGIAALRDLEPGHAEVKSMRTAPAHLRRGVARALLAHLIAAARDRGIARLSLETGTAPMFAPANALYEAHGFVDGPVFGGYPASPHNRFMTLALQDAPCPR